MKVWAIILVLILAGCAPVAPTSYVKPVSERDYFLRGAMWGCVGIVLSVASVMIDTSVPETETGIRTVCNNYANNVARVVFDTGGVNGPGEPPILVKPNEDPT